jgi:hypothetical protein
MKTTAVLALLAALACAALLAVQADEAAAGKSRSDFMCFPLSFFYCLKCLWNFSPLLTWTGRGVRGIQGRFQWLRISVGNPIAMVTGINLYHFLFLAFGDAVFKFSTSPVLCFVWNGDAATIMSIKVRFAL